MRRAVASLGGPWWLCLAAAILLVIGAGHAFAEETAAQRTAALDVVTRWKIINTAIFLIGLGWVLWKYAPAFFNARSADIQKAIQEATGLKLEADFRYSEIDRKMATLADEIRKMREEMRGEMERDHERFRHQTRLEIEHIHHNVLAEMEAFRQEGIERIRRHTSELALNLAERDLQERFRTGEPKDTLHDFIHLVEQGKN